VPLRARISLPGPVGDVLRHQELTLAAKALDIYVLIQPRGRLFTPVEFERLSLDVRSSSPGPSCRRRS
jgi:hypothetical protein